MQKNILLQLLQSVSYIITMLTERRNVLYNSSAPRRSGD